MSSRIRVRSIVGRFLEHSRIFFFENAGKSEVYLGSADWMPRNLYERVEVVFPLKDPHLCARVCAEILSSYLADTRKARVLGADGKYSRPKAVRNGHAFSGQEHLMHLAGQTEDGASGTASRPGVLRTPSVVYTPNGVTTPSSGHTAEPDTQESSNAAV